MVRVNRRALAVWLVLFGVYAATVGARAFDHSAYAGDEPRFLLSARSLAHDGDVNVFDDYRSNAYRGFYMHTPASPLQPTVMLPDPPVVTVAGPLAVRLPADVGSTSQ